MVCYLFSVCVGKRCKSKKDSSEESSEDDFMTIDRDCAVNYLKRHDLFESNHNLPSINNTEACDLQIKETIDNFYTKMIAGFKSDEDLINKTDCIVDHLKIMKFAELALKKTTFESSNISKRKRKKMVKSIEGQLKGNIEHATLICFKDTEIGDLFDEIKITHADDEQENIDYCIREYVLENNLIDLDSIKIELNPKNLNGTTIESLACKEVIVELKKAVEVSLFESFKGKSHHISRRQSKCLKKKVKRSGFFGNYLRIVVLTRDQWTTEQTALERTKFIDSTSGLMIDALSC